MLLGARPGSIAMPTVLGPSVSHQDMLPFDANAVQLGMHTQPTNGEIFRSYCAVNGVDPSTWPGLEGGHRIAMRPPAMSLEERCLESFYYHFHASHPFVLPKVFLLQVSKEPPAAPLLAAIAWVGSIFIETGKAVRDRLFDEAFALLHHPQRSVDGFLVQAMMLLIVGLDGSCQQEKARHILNDAETLALELGLNSREFASLHGRGIPVVEESWRRTWWDLYVIDGMISGVHRATNFLLFDVPAGVALPCEEEQYLTAVSLHSLPGAGARI